MAPLHATKAGAGGLVQCSCDSFRSEEHTSELQSQFHLVCRLLLEKSAVNPNLRSFPTRRSSDLELRVGGERVQLCRFALVVPGGRVGKEIDFAVGVEQVVRYGAAACDEGGSRRLGPVQL